MLQAMNTGHDGSISTVHANSARDALTTSRTWCRWDRSTCRPGPFDFRSSPRWISSCKSNACAMGNAASFRSAVVGLEGDADHHQ